MDNFWQNKIKAFLHDPPDKALYLRKRDENQRGHEDRRDALLQVLGLEFDIEETSDYWSASMQRIGISTEDFWIDFHRTDRKEHPYFIHTISATPKKYEGISNSVLGIQKLKTFQILDKVLETEKEVLDGLKDEDYKRMYFKIWRFFKELLEKRLDKEIKGVLPQELVNLPADTRCPDHSIWDHLDISSAIYGAMEKGTPALLLFKISPVQSFISAARKEKDLWAGSHLLSYITFKAIMVVVEKYGPDSIVFPHLRGQPLFDLEKFPNSDLVGKLDEKVKVANIPNRFLAIVSYEDFESLKVEIEKTIRGTLESIANDALNWIEHSDNARESTLDIIRRYFNATVEVLPVKRNLKDYAEFIEFISGLELPAKTREKYVQWLKILKELSGYSASPFDVYGLMFEILEAAVGYESSKFQKSIQPSGYKCTMCGELNAINGGVYKDMKEFWNKIAKKIDEIKYGERLCPVCLMKRYYSKWFENLFKNKTKNRIDGGFKSVVDIAMAKTINGEKYHDKFESHPEYLNFLRKLSSLLEILAEKVSIHDSSLAEKILREADRVRKKDKIDRQWYYIERLNIRSILSDFALDRDLKAELEKDERLNKIVSNVYEFAKKIHKEIAGNSEQPKYYAILIMDGDDMGRLLAGEEMKPFHEYLHSEIRNKIKAPDVKRLLTPSIHMAISRALMNFSVNKVREIVEKNNGELIYAGGDDVLALLPVDKVLRCAYEIQAEFNRSFDGWELLPAKTMSAGIMVVHYLHPLYDALERARKLENIAKVSGKDAFFIGFLTRGGQYAVAGAKWKILKSVGLQTIMELLRNEKISKRFVYNLLNNSERIPEEVVDSYVAYELSRHYDDYTRELAEKLVRCQGDILIREDVRLSTKLKGLATLLKILVECDADIGGMSE